MSIESKALLKKALTRRSTREYITHEIDMEEVKDCIMIASSAPNGANKQPWFYSVVVNETMKQEIRKQAEQVEQKFYDSIITKDWQKDLDKLNVDCQKPFLTQASCLIVVFKKMYTEKNGIIDKNYYVNESSGISIGFLIRSLHELGYQSLTYTPAPTKFLTSLLNRPNGEEAVMILAIGKGSPNYQYPDITKKSFDEVAEIK